MMSTEESNSVAAKKKLRAIQSFKKRKACILKKTMELSVLCDVEASAIVVEDNGIVSTWPENRCDVMNIINKYKAWLLDEKNKKSSELQQQPQLNEYDSSPLEELNLDESFSFGGLSMKIIEQLLNDDDDDHDDHKKLLEEVEFKLQAVTEKIQFLKAAAAEEIHQGPHYYNLGEYHQYVPQQSFMVPTPTPTPLCMVPNPTLTTGMVPDPGFFGVADGGMMMATPPTGMMMPTPGCFGIGSGDDDDAGELTSFGFGYDFNYYFSCNAY